MKFHLGLFILISFSLLVTFSYSQTQELKFNLISGTNGITLGKINGITRDKYGFMWFSDESNRCIVRFDGSHMTRYQNDPRNPNTLGGNYPECVFADSAGNIWIGFYGMGLDKFDPIANTFTHYHHDKHNAESLHNDFVTCILTDHLGNLWIGTNGGLELLNEKTGKFKHYSHDDSDGSSLSCNTVRAIYEDKAGELWIGTGFAFDPDNEGGLNHFNRTTGTFTRYLNDPKDPHSLIDNKVRAIFEDSRGTFWIGTRGDGLHIMDRKTGHFTRLIYHPGQPGQLSRPAVKDQVDHITFITEDAANKLWIGTLSNGITRYDLLTKKIMQYGNKGDRLGLFPDKSSWWANASPDGLVWISTQKANLFKVDIWNFIIPHEGSNSNDGVWAFCEESDSVCWYGTIAGLIREDLKNEITQKFIHKNSDPNSLSNDSIGSLLKDSHGDLWIGTINGLNQYNTSSGKFTRYFDASEKKATNAITSLYEDSLSNIWAGTIDGLKMLDRSSRKFIHYNNNPADVGSISSDSISAILRGDDNTLWIGTYNFGGLNSMDFRSGRCTHYLPGLTILCLYRDAQKVLWAGTSGGLFSYDKKTKQFSSFSNQNTDNNIGRTTSIIEDKENNLWVTSISPVGIYMINHTRDQIIRFGSEHGIKETYFFYTGSAFRRKNGELSFGDETGYYHFYPEKLRITPGERRLYFTNFWVDKEQLIPGDKSILKQPLNVTNEIRLNHDQNVFSISATLIDFHITSDKTIYYELEDYDREWKTAFSEERIHYFKVPPGKYILRIKTMKRNYGDWLEKSLIIIISPPWWATWWAYCIYGMLFIALAILVHRYQRERLMKAERERTRAKDLAQAQEIEKAYHKLKVTQTQLIQSEKMASLGELTAGIAHEIQNPLNFVNNFSEVNAELIDEMNAEIDKGNMNEIKNIANDIKENQQKINFHGKRADAIVKGMLQHSRSGSKTKEPTDINVLTDEYLRLSYHGLRAKDKSFNAMPVTNFDESIGKIDVLPQDIGRVVLNLFNNAFYSVNEKKKKNREGYEPMVSVSTKKLKNQIEIRVRDNGNGVPKEVVDKIFQPFFTTKPTGEGTGLGLSLSYDIIKAHEGELKVNSEEGEFAEFIILLPI